MATQIMTVMFILHVHQIVGRSLMKDTSSQGSWSHNGIAQSSEELQMALEYLVRYGYMREIRPHEMRKTDDLKQALRKFQVFARLNVTGYLDASTVSKMNYPRCGIGDKTPIVDKKRWKRFALMGKWQDNAITYKFNNYTMDMTVEEQRREIGRAFQIWKGGTPLSFEEVQSGDSEITISFFRGRHNDGYPFDGSGKTLAHAFFPGQGVRSGEAHFDDDETWTDQADGGVGTNIFMVAAHELGHALGLGHSSKLDSVMLPFYQGYIEDFKLGSDDKTAIQVLYGEPLAMTSDESFLDQGNGVLPLPTGAVNRKSSGIDGSAQNDRRPSQRSHPDLCNYGFDAVANIRNELFFIKDENFWRINDKGKLVNREETRMSSFWEGFPDVRVDAAITRPSDQAIIFISGDQYWLYTDNNNLDPESPRSLTDFDLSPGEQVDAACVWNANKHVYFFKGSKLWKLDQGMKATAWGYPKEISNLGLPNNMDAAVLGLDRHTYFFKGKQYWKLDDNLLSVTPGYPKYIGVRWFGCEPTTEYAETGEPEDGNANKTGGYGGQSWTSRGMRHNRWPFSILLLLVLSTRIVLCTAVNS